jgi:hypothetical protein
MKTNASARTKDMALLVHVWRRKMANYPDDINIIMVMKEDAQVPSSALYNLHIYSLLL